MRDLQPVVGVHLVVVLGGERRAHVEAGVVTDRQALADLAPQQEKRRGDGAGGDDDLFRANRHLPLAANPRLDGRRLPG